MIRVDLHTHTYYSHGKDSVRAMFEAGRDKGLLVQGFSEHSPRPLGYDYPREYRAHLAAHLDDYERAVRALAAEASGPEVLLGMEVDWLEEEPAFMRSVAASRDFDYLIGGIHFLGHWGFDAQASDWEALGTAERHVLYERYYRTMRRMAESGLFRIVAHPDLIKIFSVSSFHQWLNLPGSLDLVRDALVAARDSGMAMEISSAGLRKPCAEIYPCAEILHLAAGLNVPITFASDSHDVASVAHGFDLLAAFARQEGYSESLIFRKNDVQRMEF